MASDKAPDKVRREKALEKVLYNYISCAFITVPFNPT